MHPSGSLIQTALEETRNLLNEAVFDAKYSDSVLVRTFLTKAFSNVVSRVNQGSQDQVLLRTSVTLPKDTKYYQLPEHVSDVVRLAYYDSETGIKKSDWLPRDEHSAKGPGWTLDGNCIRFDPQLGQEETFEIHWTPSGFVNIHFSQQGSVPTLVAPTTFTLSDSPDLGLLGRRENEYVGCILRVLPSTGVHASRVITAYDPLTRTATLRSPLPNQSDYSPIPYEVLPAGAQAMWHATPCLAALAIGAARKITQSNYAMLVDLYKAEIKTLRDTLFNRQGRVPRHFDQNQDMEDSVIIRAV